MTLKSAPRSVVTLSRKTEAQDSFQSPVCYSHGLVPAWRQTVSLSRFCTVCISQTTQPLASFPVASPWHGRLTKSPTWLSQRQSLSGGMPLAALSGDLIVWKTHVGCGGRISCLPFPGEASAVVLADELVRVSQLPFCPRCRPSSLLRSLGSQESLELHPTGRELHGPRPHGCWRCVPPSWAVHQRAGAPLPHAAVGARVRGRLPDRPAEGRCPPPCLAPGAEREQKVPGGCVELAVVPCIWLLSLCSDAKGPCGW